MINQKRLVRLTQELIRINSQNPPGDESAIAAFVKDFLVRLGLKVKICEFKKNRSNVVAVLEGRRNDRSLLLTPHLDTVPCGQNWHYPAFGARIERGRIYGLGATDRKGDTACAMEAINSLVEDGVILDYNLIFAPTADEESGSNLGVIPLLKKGILKPSAAVVLDADDFSIVVAQKGLLHLKLKLEGKRAHGAYPWLGVNAISIASNIIQDLKRYKLCRTKNRYLRPSTLNIGTIRGGDKVNVVADWCEMELDFRFLPGESAKKIIEDLKKIVSRHTRKFKIEIEGNQRPYQIEETHPLVDGLRRAMLKMGVKPQINGSEGATVITFFQDKKIPAVACGFGCEGCNHIADEYVKIGNLYKGARVLEDFLKNYRS